MDKTQAILRRLQGELLVLERQLRHFENVITEYYNYSNLLSYNYLKGYLSVRGVVRGTLVRPEISLIDVELKVAALYLRAHEFTSELERSGHASDKLLMELLSMRVATIVPGVIEKVRTDVAQRVDICVRALPLLKMPSGTLDAHILLLRYNHAPDIALFFQ
jgi:hypothetical protein